MKKLFFILFICLIVLVLASSVLFRSSQKPFIPQLVPTPTPISPFANPRSINYSNVFQDAATKDSVIKILQNPTGYAKNSGLTVVSFPTDVADRSNQVYEQNGVAQYVHLEITTDNTKLTDFTTVHPNDLSFQLFDAKQAGSGFSWYIFPQDGMAFLANKDSGYAIQTLYFEPTTQENFVKKIAPLFNMSPTDPNSDTTRENFQGAN